NASPRQSYGGRRCATETRRHGEETEQFVHAAHALRPSPVFVSLWLPLRCEMRRTDPCAILSHPPAPSVHPSSFIQAGVLGFEPRQADPESAVLPLHHTPKALRP